MERDAKGRRIELEARRRQLVDRVKYLTQAWKDAAAGPDIIETEVQMNSASENLAKAEMDLAAVERELASLDSE